MYEFTSEEIPTERTMREPDKILVNDTYYDRVGLVAEFYGIYRYQVYGYAIEYALRNFKNFRNYVEAAEAVTDQ